MELQLDVLVVVVVVVVELEVLVEVELKAVPVECLAVASEFPEWELAVVKQLESDS